jgi:hypothetical protein
MGMTLARDPGPGNTDSGVGKKDSRINKPKRGKSIRVVPPGKEAAPQECVWSRNRALAKLGPGRVEKIADLAILKQSRGKSVLPGRATCMKQVKHSKNKSLLHLTSTG